MEVRTVGGKDGVGEEEKYYPREESDTDLENEWEKTSVSAPHRSSVADTEKEERKEDVMDGDKEEEKDVPESMKCVLCLQILLDPASLPCGHTFCQVCLVRMRISRPIQPTSLCPMCRQPWAEVPAVNILFR